MCPRVKRFISDRDGLVLFPSGATVVKFGKAQMPDEESCRKSFQATEIEA